MGSRGCWPAEAGSHGAGAQPVPRPPGRDTDVQKPFAPEPGSEQENQVSRVLSFRFSWLWLTLTRMKRVRSSPSFTNGARGSCGSHPTRGFPPTALGTGRPLRWLGSTSWPWPTTGKVGAVAFNPEGNSFGRGMTHLPAHFAPIKSDNKSHQHKSSGLPI